MTQDTHMADTSLASSIGAATRSHKAKQSKARDLYNSTISRPPFAYAQIAVVHRTAGGRPAPLDALQARSYCDTALRQFLGATGAAMPLDLLRLDARENQFWVRLAREDLCLFAAALTAWSSVSQDGTAVALQLKASGNWLGSLVGRSEQHQLWDDA